MAGDVSRRRNPAQRPPSRFRAEGWSLFAAGLLAALSSLTPTAAQEVRLPLERFHQLQRLARDSTPPLAPAALFTLERSEIEVAITDDRATVLQRLELLVSDDAWHRLEIPPPGRWVDIELAGLEGRLERGGGALVFRGAGRHSLELTAVAPVERRTRFGRGEWSVSLRAPAAGVVVGSARSELLVDAADGATVEIDGGAVALGPVDDEGALPFAARPGQMISLAVRADRSSGPSAGEAVFDADVVSVARVRPTRLALHDRISLRVVRGELSELVLGLPAGSTVNAVRGATVADWNAEAGDALRVSFHAGESRRALVEIERDLPLELSDAPAGGEGRGIRSTVVAARTPSVTGVREARSAFAIEAQSDGIPTLLDPGDSRGLSASVAPELRDSLEPPARRTARLLGEGPKPRWEVAWPDDSQVLAATVDELRADWLWGVSGRAGLRIRARVRSSGLEMLELELPGSFELTAATVDGRPIELGRRKERWAVPLRVDGEAQVIAVEGTTGAARPADGKTLELTVPAASAPISHVTVRGVLDGRYEYRLVDADRLDTSRLRTGTSQDAWAWPEPPGYVSVVASWGALSTRPGPLRVEVRDEPEDAKWY